MSEKKTTFNDGVDNATEINEKTAANGTKNVVNRRKFLGRAAMGGAAAAAFLSLPSLFNRGGTGIAQIKVNDTLNDCFACEIVPYTDLGITRRKIAYDKRVKAANYQITNMPIPTHPCNNDEENYANQNYIGSYTKGLARADGPAGWEYGEVHPDVYCFYLKALDSGAPPDFEQIKLGFSDDCDDVAFSDSESRLSAGAFQPDRQRRLENPQAGLNFDTEAKDYHQYNNNLSTVEAFPVAPTINSKKALVEILENYWQAITRDVPFINYSSDPLVANAAAELSQFVSNYTGPVNSSNMVTPELYSRGITPGEVEGPYISQLLLKDIPYGRQMISAKIKAPVNNPVNNFMIAVNKWLKIQTGQTPDASDKTVFETNPKYIRNGRDMAEYVHVDAIYQAYLNAALLLMTSIEDGGLGAPISQYNPYNQKSTLIQGYCKQNNFVEFGPSQLLSLIGEVSVRAHKAVWYQKWQVHRRLRPEAYGGLVHFKLTGARPTYPSIIDNLMPTDALTIVNNANQTYLLPQAFPEGSPMHPSYGAGHATLAGACVTILKAWFDSEQSYVSFNDLGAPLRRLYVSDASGDNLVDVTFSTPNYQSITFADELNKLAGNISIGRNIAGVHWRSDYTESVYLGEQVAIQLLRDYGFTYNEKFAGFSFRDFRGVMQTGIGATV